MEPLSIQEAANYTGFKVSYLYKLCHLGKIPYYRPTGGKVYFEKKELEAFIFRGRKTPDYEIKDHAEAILAGGRLC